MLLANGVPAETVLLLAEGKREGKDGRLESRDCEGGLQAVGVTKDDASKEPFKKRKGRKPF